MVYSNQFDVTVNLLKSLIVELGIGEHDADSLEINQPLPDEPPVDVTSCRRRQVVGRV